MQKGFIQLQISNLIIKNPDQKSQSRNTDINIVYDLVNTLASTAFKINKKMLYFILDYGIEFKLIEDLDSIENINKFLNFFVWFFMRVGLL